MNFIRTLTLGLLFATSIASADYYVEIDCPEITKEGAIDELIIRQDKKYRL